MEQAYWLDKWQKQDIFWHKQDINQDLIDYLPELGLKAGDAILVPLCGKTKDMLWLADQGLKVIGVELSPIACDDFFREINVTPVKTSENGFVKYQYQNIEIYCGDIFKLTAAMIPDVKAIFDTRALVALPTDIRTRYVKHLIACTRNKARILLICIESSSEVAGPPFPIHDKDVNALYGEHYTIRPVSHHVLTSIMPHLIEKGYRDYSERTYVIIPK